MPPHGLGQDLAAFGDAALGLLLLAPLITCLLTIYASFQRCEVLVTRAAMQAGSPGSGAELLERVQRLPGVDELDDQVCQPWPAGFVDIEESHTSMAALPFFRSPKPDRH